MPVPRGRLPNAPRVQLQPRDKNIFLTLHYCDGLMSEKQLLRYCFRDTNETNASKRLLALFDNRYLNRNCDEAKWQIYPHLVYWLEARGSEVVYTTLAENGVDVYKNTRNYIASDWKPVTLIHHLQVNDVFLKVIMDLEAAPELHMGRWLGQAFFKSRLWNGPVKIEDKHGKTIDSSVQPDGFFSIYRWLDASKAKLQVHGFILEVDRATEVQTTLSRDKKVSIDDKLKKGAALVDSPAYRDAFQLRTGRCLMVTTSWHRAENMMQLAQQAGVSWAWYFSTYDAVTNPQANILTDTVWRKADIDEPQSIIDRRTKE